MNPDISILVCTYNRAKDLKEMLESCLAQQTKSLFQYEILVVDNNSSDNTREVASQFIDVSPTVQVRYFFEPKQGKSNALNLALAQAKGHICAIGDDDLILPPKYLLGLWNAFEQHPDVSLIGGRVEPLWKQAQPDWLTRVHWPTLALMDFGDQTFFTGKDRPVCLMAAAFRKADILDAGPYDPNLSVSGTMTGGVEDAEIYSRLYQCGRRGMYEPALRLFHKVEPHRMTRAYHRHWHRGHGRSTAAWRDPAFELSKFSVLGVPSHLVKSTFISLLQWITSFARPGEQAFDHEIHLQFFWGFLKERWSKAHKP